MSCNRKRKNRSSEDAIKVFGPCEADVDNEKVFSFCRRKFPSISKKELRDTFWKKEVFINGSCVDGVEDTTKRLKKGDTVKVVRDILHLKRSKIDEIKVDIVYQNSCFVVTFKAAGVNAADGKLYDEAVKNAAFKDSTNEPYFLYRFQKNLSGLYVIAKNSCSAYAMRAMLCTGDLKLSLVCLVAGYVGAEGDQCFIPAATDISQEKNAVDTARLSVKVLRTCRCRTTGYLSLIHITPEFHTTPMGFSPSSETLYAPTCNPFDPHCATEHNAAYYPSSVLKAIPGILRAAGHPIAGGEDGIVKKAKGLYLALTEVHIRGRSLRREQSLLAEDLSSPCPCNSLYVTTTNCNTSGSAAISSEISSHVFEEWCNDSGLTVNIPIPDKITKLMDKEEELYDAAVSRDVKIIESWQEVLGRETSQQDSDEMQRAVREGVPVEYILGEATFCGAQFRVSKDVMIPRRSSEAVVTAAMECAKQLYSSHISDATGELAASQRQIRVLDIGTGSGCLLLACIRALKSSGVVCSGVGIDICPNALAIARENSERLGLGCDTEFLEMSFTDLSDLVSRTGGKSFDIIVCNPPYSSPSENRLSNSRQLHEPALALFGERMPAHCPASDVASKESANDDPFRAFTIIAKALTQAYSSTPPSNDALDSVPLLCIDGFLCMEFGHGQLNRVREIFDSVGGFQYVRSVSDYNHLQRCLILRNKSISET